MQVGSEGRGGRERRRGGVRDGRREEVGWTLEIGRM